MNKPCAHLLAKSQQYGQVTLVDHTQHVLAAAESIAQYMGLTESDCAIVRWGAILHDMGKASPIFQRRLKHRPDMTVETPFRHELASLFFIPLVPAELRHAVLEMIVAHHRSTEKDARSQGLLDLHHEYETDLRGGALFEMHCEGWETWSRDVYAILEYFGVRTRPISRQEAFDAFYDAVDYCRGRPRGWSFWKGCLVAADHLASAVNDSIYDVLKNSFTIPDLSWYHDPARRSTLYPLSLVDATDPRPHTLVMAPTGAGKTDLLMRRCRGRVFYMLPFQASINAMYERFRSTVPGADSVRLLHAASRMTQAGPRKLCWEEMAIQDKAGAPLKVLTPYQVASIAFGTKGYESMIVDLRGCDVIMDEIHTYTDVSRAIVLRIIEILCHLGCRLHVGTATMPAQLKEQVKALLGADQTCEVFLTSEQLDTFDRHIIHKIPDTDTASRTIVEAIARGDKVLVVMNQVKRAQEFYRNLRGLFPGIPSMLIHSRFLRGRRARLENQLKEEFDQKPGPCLVVSTQVVEVSLDISFDVMITEAAPLDSLIQRFGRVNRRRTPDTLSQYKPIYVIAPSEDARSSLPYDHEIVCGSYAVLPDGQALKERNVQELINEVFAGNDAASIDMMSNFRNGEFLRKTLTHQPRSVLIEAMAIETASCIRQSDIYDYRAGSFEIRTDLEIPVSFRSVAGLRLKQLQDCGSKPFIVPDPAYNDDEGLMLDKVGSENFSTCVIL